MQLLDGTISGFRISLLGLRTAFPVRLALFAVRWAAPFPGRPIRLMARSTLPLWAPFYHLQRRQPARFDNKPCRNHLISVPIDGHGPARVLLGRGFVVLLELGYKDAGLDLIVGLGNSLGRSRRNPGMATAAQK